VEVRPLEPGRRKISGVKTKVRGFEVRGVEIDGEPAFKEKFTLYFANDAKATPLEITGKQGWVRLRIQLVKEDVQKLGLLP
jgi:hypothetical protein